MELNMELIGILLFSLFALLFSLISLAFSVYLTIQYRVFMGSTQQLPLKQLGSDLESMMDEITGAVNPDIPSDQLRMLKDIRKENNQSPEDLV